MNHFFVIKSPAFVDGGQGPRIGLNDRKDIAMTNRTLTRADLAESVYEQVGLSRNESSDLVEQVLDEISNTLIESKGVKISSFGSFSIREKGERIGRNPKTGVEVPILPRKVLVFRASHVLKDRINKGA
jgi:integration host factor subunit alpha